MVSIGPNGNIANRQNLENETSLIEYILFLDLNGIMRQDQSKEDTIYEFYLKSDTKTRINSINKKLLAIYVLYN